MSQQKIKSAKRWLLHKDKVPYYISGIPRNGKLDSSEDVDQLATYEEAVKVFEANPGKYTGLGFALGPDGTGCYWQGIDLDNIPENQLSAIANSLPSYVEFSPSGNGCHAIGYGKQFQTIKGKGVEAYSEGRYFTFTDDIIRNEPLTCLAEFVELNILPVVSANRKEIELVEVEEYLTDDEVWASACNAENSEKFKNLCSGKWIELGYPSQSEADYALISMFCFYTWSNSQVRRLFRQTVLGRRDKAVKDDTYLNRTLAGIRGRQEDERKGDRETIEQGKHIAFLYEKYHKEKAQKEINHNAEKLVVREVEDNESEIEWPPGFVGELAQWIYKTSIRPVKKISIMTALGVLSGIYSGGYNRGDLAPNLFLIMIANSGVGKDEIHKAPRRLIREMEKYGFQESKDFIANLDFASPQALRKAIPNFEHNSICCLIPEIGEKLNIVSKASDKSPMYGLKNLLIKLHDKSSYGSVIDGLIYSDKEKNVDHITHFSFCFMGDTTPTIFDQSLNDGVLADGFVSRLITIEYRGPRVPENYDRFHPLPESIACALNNGIKLTLHRDVDIRPIETDIESTRLLHFYNLKCDRLYNEAGTDDSILQLWNRAYVKVLKIASLLAVADSPAQPIIKKQYVEWAIGLVEDNNNMFIRKLKTEGILNIDHSCENAMFSLFKKYIKGNLSSGYRVNEDMRKQGIISRSYIQNRTKDLAVFRRPIYGPNEALKRTLANLIENGYIIELQKNNLPKEWEVVGKVYQIVKLGE